MKISDNFIKEHQCHEISDVLGYDSFINIELLDKGWSTDKKYIVETADGQKQLLRIADIVQHDHKMYEFEMMKRVVELGIPMSQPIEFGICNNGEKVYQLLSWVEGEDAETILPLLSEAEQYVFGLESGKILHKIHSISTPHNEVSYLAYRENWAERFNRKVDRNIKMYKESAIKVSGGDNFINYIECNRKLLEDRPQCFQHGDYHVGNMIINNSTKTLSIIDFNRYDFGDPGEEFNRIVWSASVSPRFATGQLHGYFGATSLCNGGSEPPLEFFKLLAFYIASNALAHLPWAIPFGNDEIETAKKQMQCILEWFNNMNNPVPTWYLKDEFLN
ncbi:MAG: phosphotransferase [Oscillospiraceae bacterium]|jgi:serine/threonine-protein kinase|nr:phosphotransferase [Oscillospiraceae bacterium]